MPADDKTLRLSVVKRNVAARNRLDLEIARMIREASTAGASLREIAIAAGMTPEGVRQLLKRTEAK